MEIDLPNNWVPRAYQRPAWDYLESGGKRAYLVWHRRSGKDDVCLHWTSAAMFERVGTYWHMLPEAAQARKAIWEAVNPHSGKRRIAEAFPHELRATTHDHEMFLRTKNGSTWQVVGSDNYDSLVGSPPIGVVFSEWALAKSEAWAYLRPILAENGGWAIFVTTPRGKNHAYTMLQSAEESPGWFAQVLPVTNTSVFTAEQLQREKNELIREHGEHVGRAMYEQEYECSFEAPMLGAIWGSEITKARSEGRITKVPYDRSVLVHTGWDLGVGDSTAIWFAQFVANEIRLIDYYEATGEGLHHYAGVLQSKGYSYAPPIAPHDIEVRELGSGKSRKETGQSLGLHFKVAANLKLEDGINAVRTSFNRMYFDSEKCKRGIEVLSSYRWTYNKEIGEFTRTPVHDWASHGADAMRYLIVGGTELKKDKPIKYSVKGIV